MKKYYFIIFILTALISLSAWWYVTSPKKGINPVITSFDECVAEGYPVLESYPAQCKTSGGKSFTQDVGNELEKLNLIRVNNPRPNQTIKSPITITGQARGYWFFEASFPIKLYDENNNLLAVAIAEAQKEWMTEDFVPFKAEMNFEILKNSKKGVLVFEKDNPSGLPEHDDQLRMPVVFEEEKEKEMIKVKAFFGNSKLDPEYSCNKVFAVEREVPKTQAVGRAALEELLMGATEKEKSEGYFTSLNSGVTIQNLTIENGVAKVDFDKQLEFQIGGSCRVSAIRSQITETLKQFPTAKEVVISIDGRTEDILQP